MMVAALASSTMLLHPSSPSVTFSQHQTQSGIRHAGVHSIPVVILSSSSSVSRTYSELGQRGVASKSLTFVTPGERRERRERRREGWSNGWEPVRISAAEGGMRSGEPLKAMISGAPASGKGTQCELIVEKFGLSHISTGELLRAEVTAGSEIGQTAKGYMDAGKLVPNEIVVEMVEKQLALSQKGWLLDGYPRSLEQAEALEAIGVRPQLFILLEVPDDVLVERVVGRRTDPLTGKIYHLKYSPPETDEIRNRLTQRFDDTEEKAKIRLATYRANVQAVVDVYSDIIRRVDGNRPKKEVFADIEKLLSELEGKDEGGSSSNGSSFGSVKEKEAVNGSTTATAVKESPSPAVASKQAWIGVPTKLNSTPHSREIREYFYNDVCTAVKRAVEDGLHKLRVQVTIPELNPEMDVFRIGTLLELMRELAFTFANDGKRVRVCVQGSMGEGIFSGMPLQLAGTRQLLDRMDWGEYGAKGTFINIGAVGAKEVNPDDDMFILIAPQNAVGNCIIDNLKGMVAAAGDRPVIIVNPRLKDLPGSGGVMQVLGREKRLEFVGSFFTCYHFRLLYQSATLYPILGALRYAYPSPYQIYKRLDTETKSKEEYALLPQTFETQPTQEQIADAYYGRIKAKAADGVWGFLTRVLG